MSNEAPETALRQVGRIQSALDILSGALADLPHSERHARDLILVAHGAANKAMILLWGKAPELPGSAPDAL